jgi:hypothetical protein
MKKRLIKSPLKRISKLLQKALRSGILRRQEPDGWTEYDNSPNKFDRLLAHIGAAVKLLRPNRELSV